MITVDYKDHYFLLWFPYNEGDLAKVRSLPNREWIKKEKIWKIPELATLSLEKLSNCKWTEEAEKRKDSIKKALLSLVDLKFKQYEKRSILREYQATGVEYLKKAKKVLLADDTGLGKTIQAIQAMLDLNLSSNLIVCPATLKYNWANEFKKHFGIGSCVVAGNKTEREKAWKSDTQFKIANYDLLSADASIIKEKWDVIVVDEAVYLKNPKADRTQAARKLKSDYRWALSGIPMETNLLDFHSIMEWVRPGLLAKAYPFKYRHTIFDWAGKPIGYKNLEEIHVLTSPFVLRRKKEDVLKELPPKIFFDIQLEFGKEERKAYDAIREEFLEWLKEQTGNNWQSNALTKLVRMRQFVEFPSMVGFKNFQSAKLEWLKELKEAEAKIVVFTPFVESLKNLKEIFETKYIIYGDIKAEDRIKTIDEFNQVENGILISTDAGRFGINITGANNIVHFGYFFNPATITQREDRLHRIGQKSVVNVFRPAISDTVDEGIQRVFLNRAEEASDFMEGSSEMSFSRLSKKDFMEVA